MKKRKKRKKQMRNKKTKDKRKKQKKDLKASNKKVYFLSCGRWLGKNAFLNYFEKKVKKTIRKFNLINEDDKIAVAYSGGKDSLTLLYLLNKIYGQRHKVIGLAIDEGIPGYRNKILEEAKEFLRNQGIEVKIFSFKKEFGFALKSKVKRIKQLGVSNCYVCSILKRWLINKKAQELGFDVAATAHSLDDEAESIILNLLKGDPKLMAKLGPSSGVAKTKGFVQRIKPFYLCSTKEIVLYAKLKKLPIPKNANAICPLRGKTFRVEIRKWLSDLEEKHIEVKNAIVKSLLKMIPMLKKQYKEREFKRCKVCGFPSSQDICKACLLLKKLK